VQYSAVDPVPRYGEGGVKSSPRQDTLQALSAVVTRALNFKMVMVRATHRAEFVNLLLGNLEDLASKGCQPVALPGAPEI